ncbi:hypothetical protein DFH09DRAFT_1353592 [Mycena vulgaris]|nr:hypothetical protein DFH09DRAFT_1353592 [Mycena vulgaris]
MRRGFLNKPRKARSDPQPEPPSSKSDASAAREATPESQPADSEPEVEEKKGNELPLDPHSPPQWLLDESTHLKGQTRFIFRQWPRDPNGEAALPMEPGKMAPNGIVWWGATLYDFYSFTPIPGCANYIVTSTGSRLAATMRRLGELDAAAPEIMWADREEDPRQLVLPIEIARDLEPVEGRVASQRAGDPAAFPPWALAGADFRSVRGAERASAAEVPLPASDPDAHCNIASIQPENYPGPWPLVPFSLVEPALPKLETLIPYTLLPEKLIVHDPWNLLSMPAEIKGDVDTDWAQMPDIVRTYELEPLTEAGLGKSDHQHEVFRGRVDDSDFIIPSLPYDETVADGSGPCPPYLKIKVPPYPHKKTTPAAHLYISPASKAGVGNHSAVYHAEWELPRSLLVPDVFCRQCVADELDEMRVSGELDQIINDATADLDDVRGHLAVQLEVAPAEVVDVSKLSRAGYKDENLAPDIRIVRPRTVERTCAYSGPIVDVHTKVQWQTPGRGTNCAHVRIRASSLPPTATVRVCAKLSIQDDRHLAREAEVYQALPAHLSEHWSGYNLVRPSRAPVPVGAVVPQFYGYYAPAAHAEAYLSPIMLLENCGTPLDADVLSPDQKTECWSLLQRLHHADWVHGSVAERNVVVQAGPMRMPQGWMREWEERDAVSFRVIDFGRSLYCGAKEEGAKDVYQGLRAEGDSSDRICLEGVEVDRLLSQGYMFN